MWRIIRQKKFTKYPFDIYTKHILRATTKKEKEQYSYGMENSHVISARESEDMGEIWQKLGQVEFPEGISLDSFHEPYFTEISDGRILGIIHEKNIKSEIPFKMYKTISDDGGKTRSNCRAMGISGSPPHLLRHSSVALILSYARSESPCGERAVISYDEGKPE